jgi:hypothetical protein
MALPCAQTLPLYLNNDSDDEMNANYIRVDADAHVPRWRRQLSFISDFFPAVYRSTRWLQTTVMANARRWIRKTNRLACRDDGKSSRNSCGSSCCTAQVDDDDDDDDSVQQAGNIAFIRRHERKLMDDIIIMHRRHIQHLVTATLNC